MVEQFSFGLIEKLELMQRIRTLETENVSLKREVERLTLQNQLLREDMKAFAERQTRPRVLAIDRRGFVVAE